jgi:phenylacetate-CoA ligase
MIWNRDAECMPIESLRRLQLGRLQHLLERLEQSTPFYQRAFRESGCRAAELRSLDDLVRFPFTTKAHIRETPARDLVGSPPAAPVLEVHSSTGTTGRPALLYYAQADLDLWGEVCARALASAGVTAGDVVQIAFSFGLSGGQGLLLGAQRLGALAAPIGSGQTLRQMDLIRHLGTTVLLCTPNYALYLAEAFEDAGDDIRRYHLARGMHGACPWTPELRAAIEERLGIQAANLYGLMEMLGAGVAGECPELSGLHLNSDHFFPEIVDPASGAPLPDGQRGELVLTSLSKSAMPFLRYRTRDMVSIDHRPCPCGRTLPRISWPAGRVDDAVFVRGVTILPSDVEAILLSFSELEPIYRIELFSEGTMDQMRIRSEVRPERVPSPDARSNLERRIAETVKSRIGVRPLVSLEPPRTLERQEFKALRVFDLREV